MLKVAVGIQPNNSIRRYLWCALILALVIVVLLPSSPWLYRVPDTDSSIFLIIGQKILAGQFPYRDWYDHKPPLIFYLNALGLALGRGSRWGVWAVELTSLSAAALFGFNFLRRYFGNMVSGLAMSFGLINLAFMLERGNLTEEYALPFQFAAIFLLSEFESKGKSGWRLFGIGFMLAMASSLKQPLAGIGLSIVVYLAVVYLLQGRLLELIRAYLKIGLGFVFVWTVWFAYFAISGVFPDFWEAAFQYNFALSGIPLREHLLALSSAFMLWGANSGYFFAGMICWLIATIYLFTHDDRLLRFLSSKWVKMGFTAVSVVIGLSGILSLLHGAGMPAFILSASGLVLSVCVWFFFGWFDTRVRNVLERHPEERSTPLFLPLIIALVDLPVAFLLSSLSGNNYNHYFMTLLPSMSILVAFGIMLFTQGVQYPQPERILFNLWAAVLALALVIPGIQKTSEQFVAKTDRQVEEVVAYVNQNTQPGDYVYQWGISPGINLLSGRDSPTRFFFADPLFVVGYSNAAQSNLLLSELKSKPPVLIINSEIPRLPLIMVRDPKQCDQVKDINYYNQVIGLWTSDPAERVERPEGMEKVYDWICQNYVYQLSLGELQWDVYRLKGK